MINYVVDDSDPPLIIQKLNQHFPHWNAAYRTNIAKSFQIENSKILDKVAESHTQCRRLILRLAMDKSYREKYLSEQYSNDISRLKRESKAYLSEVIVDLESCAGNSSVEKASSAEANTHECTLQLFLTAFLCIADLKCQFIDNTPFINCPCESDCESSEDEEISEDDKSSKDDAYIGCSSNSIPITLN
ncbi:uncharacterized protein TNIN_280001 [Trichonephila inaurata madagascariensis]|uniref:Uncharacterized protein n=1 Tax=Trichonephila inaurata madagascariensis TaxID=2747483 RepID=A0A8X6Y9E8_9ARAC|nr:uncharacterized protein TNIN_280001 [Trichonephila inaurata madagascariensis]